MTKRSFILITVVCGILSFVGLWFIVASLKGSKELAGIPPAAAFSAVVILFILGTVIQYKCRGGCRTESERDFRQ